MCEMSRKRTWLETVLKNGLLSGYEPFLVPSASPRYVPRSPELIFVLIPANK